MRSIANRGKAPANNPQGNLGPLGQQIEGNLVLHVRRELLLALLRLIWSAVARAFAPPGEVDAKSCGGRLVKPRPQRISVRAELT